MLNKILYVFVALVVITGVARLFISPEVPAEKLDDTHVSVEAKANLITLEAPLPNAVVLSPFTIKGKARGNWFFEASFPIILTNWDGLIIAEGYATAESEWMTTDFVPFTATLDFLSPFNEGDPDFIKKGSLILKKDNPSGLPENDDALEIPVRFAS